jgi:hypothetical protein
VTIAADVLIVFRMDDADELAAVDAMLAPDVLMGLHKAVDAERCTVTVSGSVADVLQRPDAP